MKLNKPVKNNMAKLSSVVQPPSYLVILKKIILMTVLLFTINLFAEDDIEILEDDLNTETEIVDESQIPDLDIHDDIEHEVYTGFYLPKSPAKAAFLSAFIPGAGQYYNETYLKSVFWVGVQTGLVLRTVHHNERVNRFRHRRHESDYDKQRYHDAYDARQSFIFWIGTSVLLSAMDAYVDAHLINFKQLRDEIHLRFEDDKVIISFRF